MGLRGGPTTYPQQIQDGELYWISQNANIYVLDEDIHNQFGTKMQHGQTTDNTCIEDSFQPTM